RFIGIVAQARHKSPQQVDAIAQGRVWDGGTARQIGLVDGFGGMSEAIAKAAELAKLGDARGVRYYEPPMSLEDELVATFAGDDNDEAGAGSSDAFAGLADRANAQLAAALGEAEAILAGPTIQARCMECAVYAAPRADPRRTRLMDLIRAWLAG
ncbi:MAG TPA: S49 family peptidase, partial [Sphingomicrobium sp.]|nr:S49 family peptidase [Sphingomicrobium sp.]